MIANEIVERLAETRRLPERIFEKNIVTIRGWFSWQLCSCSSVCLPQTEEALELKGNGVQSLATNRRRRATASLIFSRLVA